jgi:hypothetical protein
MKIIIVFLIISVFVVYGCSGDQSNKQTVTDSVKTDSLKLKPLGRTELSEELKGNVIYEQKDVDKFIKTIDTLVLQGFNEKPINELIIEVGKKFIDFPYVGQTLEKDSTEKLVINLTELDCTTFLENMVTLSRIIKQKKNGFDDFCKELTHLRYRNGERNEYPSRLHYFTDWMYDNQQKGIISIISDSIGTKEFAVKVGFMSKNRTLYKQLANDGYCAKVAETEKEISKRKFKFIPTANLQKMEPKIKDGDLIAIVTNKEGLDIAHVGFACWENNRLHFMHASSGSMKVEITKIPLADYLKGRKTETGIMVGRLIEPK